MSQKFQVTFTKEQIETLERIGKKLGVGITIHGNYNRNETIHYALNFLCEHHPDLQGIIFGEKPSIGGARGGSMAQAKQKLAARRALQHAKTEE